MYILNQVMQLAEDNTQETEIFHYLWTPGYYVHQPVIPPNLHSNVNELNSLGSPGKLGGAR